MRKLTHHVAVAALFLVATAFTHDDSGRAAAANAVAVDTATAVRLISEYRVSRGLSPVRLDPRLTRIAAVHAERMAAADRLDHVLPGEGSFQQRMAAGGYSAAVAAENISAGYSRLSDTIAGWKASPAHNANLLQPNVTDIGIALYSTPTGAFHTYWALVLARPMAQAPAGGPGPSVGVTVGPFGFFGSFN